MKDNAIKWLTELNPFDKVKGHTKIELTDVKTGKKQVIEKDNAFQAGVLAKYMRSMGAYNNNPYANGTWAGQQIWRNLCGGIFCFRDPIDLTDGEVEYMPAGNEMVANGAYMVNNAGTPIELGSYNEVESSTSGNDSVTFVYDWLTSQGNGTISCVCLTTEIGGYIGYGNKSGASKTAKNICANQSSNAYSLVPYDNFRYNFSVEEGVLHVTRTPHEITKGSIFDKITEDTHDVSFVGTTSGTGIWGVFYIGNGQFAILTSSGLGYQGDHRWYNGTTYSFLIYDTANDTATVKTFTNNTGVPLYIQSTINAGHNAICAVSNNYIYFMDATAGHQTSTYDTDIYAFKISDGSSSKVINSGHGIYPRGGTPWGEAVYEPRGILIAPDLIFWGNNKMYDETTKTLYITNGTIDSNFYQYHSEYDFIHNRSNGYCVKSPLILATVNNLETPVTKTAAQTMKITYTLTKASE